LQELDLLFEFPDVCGAGQNREGPFEIEFRSVRFAGVGAEFKVFVAELDCFEFECLDYWGVVALPRWGVGGRRKAVVLGFKLVIGGFGLAKRELEFLYSLLNRDQGECR
jgi:hypothetical protein